MRSTVGIRAVHGGEDVNFIKPEYKDKYEQLLVVQNVLQKIYSVDRQLKKIRKFSI